MEADTCATTVVDEDAVTVAASQGSLGSSPRPAGCGQRAAMDDAEMDDTCVGVCGVDDDLDRDGAGDRDGDEDDGMPLPPAASQRTPSPPREKPGVEAEDDRDTCGAVCADDTRVPGWRQSPPDPQPDSVVVVPATLFPDTFLPSVVCSSERPCARCVFCRERRFHRRRARKVL